MTIILYDGATLECSEIEISGDGKRIIVDGCRIVPWVEVLRIIAK